MSEYKEGIWYGWNGGKCPVHPMSSVQVVWLRKGGSICQYSPVDRADKWCWVGNECGKIIAFRIVKEHKEPREFWISGNDGIALTTLEAAEWDYEAYGKPFIHVREVLEDE